MGINETYTPDRLSGLSAFVAAADAGSFSAAAQRLHLTRSAVAKRVGRLEARLGVRLFHRTTRSQHLTDEGQTFYQRCTKVLAELSDAENELSAGSQTPMGRLRVTMPVQIGRQCIAPVLLALARAHPQLRLEMAFSDRRIDLVEEGYDLAVRSGHLDDTPGLKARLLGKQTMVLCASPAYLAERGTPRTPADLDGHERLMYGRNGSLYEWTALSMVHEARHAPRFVLDDLVTLADAAEQGLGVACLPHWVVAQSLSSGKLLRLLPQVGSPATPLHLVWPDTRHPSPKLRAAIDALVDASRELLATPNAS
ncbi:LysR family transcriptional regulator [Pandoraea fibrosis]|uniref:LysR family transcriptional regulator n=1 Tax=Pandoraea fibrosis TaxID=1891094 RepID=A0ABX6HQ88_9BURK|nr:LysR family transcriptional regulator [Pandoraea fibrosis]QHE93370.1 LysR family transcriptional regulator [Pandoraea fibrosis]QHF13070.1 LysR family transcriptional regulator [Pandoraea fibrosis]